MDTLATEVLHQLQHGKAHAIPGKLLAQRLGEKDTRGIRLAIIDLIEGGEPIIGDPNAGYFIAETAEEVKEGLDRLMHYLEMTAYHHKVLLHASDNLLKPGQLPLKM